MSKKPVPEGIVQKVIQLFGYNWVTMPMYYLNKHDLKDSRVIKISEKPDNCCNSVIHSDVSSYMYKICPYYQGHFKFCSLHDKFLDRPDLMTCDHHPVNQIHRIYERYSFCHRLMREFAEESNKVERADAYIEDLNDSMLYFMRVQPIKDEDSDYYKKTMKLYLDFYTELRSFLPKKK